jgi:hypothetical protein
VRLNPREVGRQIGYRLAQNDLENNRQGEWDDSRMEYEEIEGIERGSRLWNIAASAAGDAYTETVEERENEEPSGSCECSDPGCTHCEGACTEDATVWVENDGSRFGFCEGCSEDAAGAW